MIDRIVIAFCGSAGSGKDEAARVLVEQHGFVKRSFAEALRQEVRLAFIDSAYCDSIWPTMPECVQDAFRCCESTGFIDPWAKPTAEPMRRLLQFWGTEFRRSQDSDYWTKREFESLPSKGRFVYTDVRFPNEQAMIASVGGRLFRIERNGVTGNGHVSESYWPSFPHDATIRNDRTVEHFHQAVIVAASPYLNEPSRGKVDVAA